MRRRAFAMLIVGLGNPGRAYEHTRHNIGFDVVERLAARWAPSEPFREKLGGKYVRVRIHDHDCVLLMPQTYMNNSGACVQPMARFFKEPLERIVVVHDELDLKLGDVRVKKGGGHAGHNGLRNIIALMGDGFVRVRIGIGRPPASFQGDVADWVLSRWTDAEKADVRSMVERAAQVVEDIVVEGVDRTMNIVNVRPKVRA